MNKQTTTITIIIAIIIAITVILVVANYNKSKVSNNLPKDQQVQEDTNPTDQLNQSDKENQQLANPASVYCIKNNGEHKTIKDDKGNEIGICVFSNGKECNEWEFYRGNCTP